MLADFARSVCDEPELADALAEILEVTGDTTDTLAPEHLGYVRRVWLDKHYLSIRGGRGDTKLLRGQLAEMRSAFN